MNTLLILIALLTNWAGLSNANAFYDPGTQRWLNRDPAGDESIIQQERKQRGIVYSQYLRFEAFGNLYEFNHDRPNGYVDINGRQIAVPSVPAIIIIGGIAITIAACEANPWCRQHILHLPPISIPFPITGCPTAPPPNNPPCKLKGAGATGYGNEDTHCVYDCGGKEFSITVGGGFGDSGACPQNPKQSDLQPSGSNH